MTPKIQLSHAEMQLICNAEVILTKNVIMQKTVALLEAVQQQQLDWQKDFKTFFPQGLFGTTPKISRGENYGGLPYLILDYPRLFTRTDTFAIRTLFWWGRFFSSTLHLSGSYKTLYQKKLQNAFDRLAPQHFIGINPDPWQHHFEQDNYTPIGRLAQKEFETFLQNSNHLKIAACFPLTDWEKAEELLFQSWRQYLTVLTA